MRRFLPLCVCADGLLIVILGIVVGPGVPYQDPTPEMRALEARQVQLSDRLAIVGCLILASGVLWVITRWIARRISRSAATRKHTISLLLPIAFVVTGCHTYTQAPGAVGRVVDAETAVPIRGARITRPFIARGIGIPAEGLPATTVSSDESGRFNLAPATHTQIAFMHLSNPESVSGSFVISAAGYTTNVLHGIATSRSLWRADLGKILLRKP